MTRAWALSLDVLVEHFTYRLLENVPVDRFENVLADAEAPCAVEIFF